MLFLFFSNCFSFLQCLSFSGHKEVCARFKNCIYINKTCFQKSIKNENIIPISNSEIGSCYTVYSEDGCANCISRVPSIQCGWCLSLGVCTEGNEMGSNGAKCEKEDWQFNKTKCNHETCNAANSKNKCRMPCIWNNKQNKCVISQNDVINRQEFKINALFETGSVLLTNKTKFILIGTGIGVGITLIITIVLVVIIKKKKTPVYQKLPLMESKFNLDRLPPA
ncbi:hypothetical protein TRFO_04008 [Tritrichomonas foetus]|uniref:Plexin repeat family protein n=1 Tax=Tritrichomonas foetus TaxID=1144522 RepID=A0A1J4KJ17_9EUKA|nr:hypothetical protein TRFO_04008 [Tritrichomonas foetus]|eukprot:OHT11074.1 hypothetical protein TRFO_04008 [Tritrichomonas foetus]